MGSINSGLDKLKYLDAYQKFDEELQKKTYIGGTVTLVCWLSIFTLVSFRVHEFMTKRETEETIFVDTSRSPKLRINLDIVFNQISCGYLSLDAMDNSGEQHLHIDHNIYKRRLDLNGNPLEEPQKENVGAPKIKKKEVEEATTTSTTAPKCGSCYGAESPELNITCCNTCEEVKEAYRIRRWSLKETDVEQCRSSEFVKEMGKAFKEGCQIYGYMEVNRVSGSFHIAPGQSFSINHVHVHDVQPYSSSSFNTSHYIKHLTFGMFGEDDMLTNVQDKINLNPLAGTQAVATEGATMFNHYIKIVPTLVKSGESVLQTYQYSVTKHDKVITPMSGESGMPGVFFSYELSALTHQVTEKVLPWSHLATDICSIIGGVWIVAMNVAWFLGESSRYLKEKNYTSLGKVS